MKYISKLSAVVEETLIVGVHTRLRKNTIGNISFERLSPAQYKCVSEYGQFNPLTTKVTIALTGAFSSSTANQWYAYVNDENTIFFGCINVVTQDPADDDFRNLDFEIEL